MAWPSPQLQGQGHKHLRALSKDKLSKFLCMMPARMKEASPAVRLWLMQCGSGCQTYWAEMGQVLTKIEGNHSQLTAHKLLHSTGSCRMMQRVPVYQLRHSHSISYMPTALVVRMGYRTFHCMMSGEGRFCSSVHQDATILKHQGSSMVRHRG